MLNWLALNSTRTAIINPYAFAKLGIGEAMIRISSGGTSEVLIDPPREPAGRATSCQQSRPALRVARAEVEKNIERR